jgi:hypothetical protein
MTYTEYFEEGTEPTEVCDKHVGVTICTESGLRATDQCPSKSTKVYMSLDSNAVGDSDDSDYALVRTGKCTLDHVAASISASISESESIEESSRAEEESSIAAEESNAVSEGGLDNSGNSDFEIVIPEINLDNEHSDNENP